MRNLIPALLLCLCWLAPLHLIADTGPSASGTGSSQTAAPGVFTMPDPVAWKQVLTYSSRPGKIVLVALVDGNRWRVEGRALPSTAIVVSVFNGDAFVSSNPVLSSSTAAPKPQMLRNFAEWNRLKPTGSGVRDGRLCWLFTDGPDENGAKGNCWVDKVTRFPVLLEEWAYDGTYAEEHCQLLKPDVVAMKPAYFDTGNLDPVFTSLLNP